MLSIVSESNNLTMSHYQIADVVGSRADSVKRTMQRLHDRGVIKLTPMVGVNHLGQSVNEYHVDKRNSYIVVAQLSPEFTAVLVDRWQELEEELKPKLPATYIEALEKLIETEKEKIAISHERDHAIKTKAEISDKKTATAMATASVLSRKVKSLENRLQDVGKYQSIIAAQLPQRIETETNSKAQTWRVLMKMCKEMNLPPKKVKDERYGEVNTYHVDVINRFIEEYL